MSKTSPDSNPKKRQPRTPRGDCEAIGDKLPKAEGELLAQIVDLANRSLNRDIHIEKSMRVYPDNSHVCLCCGFPSPVPFTKCPNCGQELTPIEGKVIKQGTGLRWISVFTQRKGALGTYLIQRQFTVDIRLQEYPYQMVTTSVDEVYRNFISEDGKLLTFKRGLNPFPYTCINPFNTGHPMKYTSPDKYHPYYPPSYCEFDWNEAINERLWSKMRAKLQTMRLKHSTSNL